MKKEFLKIGIAVLLLLAIAIPLSLYRKKELEKNIAEDQNKRLISLNVDSVQRIQITNKSGDVVMDRRKKDASGNFNDEFDARSFEYKDKPEWVISKPNRALADPNMMENFFKQVNGLMYDKVIQETKERKKDYDLDPAQLSIRFFQEDITEPKLIVDMGSENPGNSGFYFATNDKPGIYLGERVLQPYKTQGSDEWSEKRVLGIPNPGELEYIKVQRTDKKDAFEVTRDKADWKLGPVTDNLAADINAIGNYAATLDSLRATIILNDGTLIQGKKTLGQVEMKFKDKKDPVSFSIYNDPKDKSLAYIQRSDIKSVFQIKMNEGILPSSQNMVNRKLMSKSLNDLATVKVTRGASVLDILNDKQVWKIIKPYADDANPRRLDSILKSISDLKPKEYLPAKVLNTKDLKLRIEYTLADPTNPGDGAVSFYQEGKEFFVRADGTTKARVFSISQIPPDISEHLGHLRNDDLVPVSDEHVKRIAFTKGVSKAEIEQDERRQQWLLKSLDNVPATVSMKWKQSLTAEELFNRASEMYIVDFIDHPDPNAKYTTATLDIFSDQDRQYTWQFGEKKGELINVYSPDRKVAGTMPWVKYQELATFLEEPVKSDKKK